MFAASMPILAMTAPTSGGFTWLDWSVVAVYMALTTVVGARFAGRASTMRDFFLGGRKLPWYAVSGSIIATEISALTFVAVPAIVYRDGGNFTYLQLGLFGSLLARLIVGYVLVPAYYRQEIYSPYDYIGNRLGEGARRVTTALFALGGILAQSARVYLTAVVLELILRDSAFGWIETHTGISTLTASIWAVGVVAILWTWMGGIATVIWTDLMLFVAFLAGAIVALIYIVQGLPGGVGELFAIGDAAGKFHTFDFDVSPTKAYTIWTAVIASTWHNVGAYGTDQMMAQRMFCCRGPREARWAILTSYAGIAITILVLFVGVGLFAYHRVHPLTAELSRLVSEKPDRIFPLFMIHALPPGVTGLLIAAVFAAAISSLDSILAALSQTTITTFYLPWRRRRRIAGQRSDTSGVDDETESREAVAASRVAIVLWGITLCLLAQVASQAAAHYPSILDLGLAMAGYAGGGLLAAFLLAFLPLKVDGRGICWSAPISVLTVFALVWHQLWARWACGMVAILVAILWGYARWRSDGKNTIRKTLVLLAALALAVVLSNVAYGVEPGAMPGSIRYITIAWPWYSPIGCMVAFAWGYLLSDRGKSAS